METPDFSLFAKRVANKLGRPFGINPFPRSFSNPLSNGAAARAVVFDRVFSENYWGSVQSRSGHGSEESFARKYRSALEQLVRRRGFRSVFDAPCGDLNWMGDLALHAGWKYTGGDISPLVIEQVKRKHPTLAFHVFDICEDTFPDADVWHCRDCLFHLPLADIRRALENFSRSNVAYALLTTHRARLLHRNLDVTIGGFRYLDLQRGPFFLPEAEEYVPDYRRGTDFPRYVGLWSRNSIATAVSQWP
jgi:hypothetical protein